MPSDPIISHGRGGAGNIEHDGTIYADGEIVREGPLGDQGDGAYSAGRGGIGNIASPSIIPPPPRKSAPGDVDNVPETATRPRHEAGTFHTGIGGGGNVHRDHASHGEHTSHGHEGQGQGQGQGREGLMEKAKHLFGGGGGGGK